MFVITEFVCISAVIYTVALFRDPINSKEDVNLERGASDGVGDVEDYFRRKFQPSIDNDDDEDEDEGNDGVESFADRLKKMEVLMADKEGKPKVGKKVLKVIHHLYLNYKILLIRGLQMSN